MNYTSFYIAYKFLRSKKSSRFTSIISKSSIIGISLGQVIEKEAPLEKFIRVGGMVKKGSVLRSNNNLKISFKIYDLEQQINVMYEGILPDLFAEGQGVVMTGRLINSNTFIADEVLAKQLYY